MHRTWILDFLDLCFYVFSQVGGPDGTSLSVEPIAGSGGLPAKYVCRMPHDHSFSVRAEHANGSARVCTLYPFYRKNVVQRLLVAVRRHAASLGFVGDIPADIFVRIVLHLDPVSLSAVEACNPVRSFVRFTRTNA